MIMRGPTLRVDVRGPSSIGVGKASPFEVLVSNPGQIPAEGVLVAIDFPAMVNVDAVQGTNGEIEQTDGTQAARIIWTVEQVASGGQQKLTLQLTPTQNAPFNLATEWTLMPLNGVAQIQVTQPALAMEVTGPQEVQFGQTATFKFDVTNSGSGLAENVMVRLPEELGGDSKPLGNIPAGESRSFVLEVTPVEAGEMEISATALADGGLSQQASAKFVTRRANLDVAITGPEFKFAGTVATYDLVIRNTGDAIATEVIAAAALPEGADYIDGVEGGEQVEGGVRWTIGQLAPNEQRVYAIRCILNQAGALQFEAGARGAGELAGANAVATTVEAVADLALHVEDPKGPKPVGEEVTYTLRITNRGSKQATNVNLLCQFSEGIEPTRVRGAQAELAPGQVLFQPIARIDAGQEVVIEVTARSSKEGNITFRAELTCDTPETRRLFEATTRFFGSSRPSSTTSVPSPRGTTAAAPTSSTQPPSSFGPANGSPTTPSPAPTEPAPSGGQLQPPANAPLPSLPTGGSFRAGLMPRPGSSVPR